MVVIDTHVVDELAVDEAFRVGLLTAVQSGELVVLLTHLQIDEILAMPTDKLAKQAVLLQHLGQIPASRRPTVGIVLDVSRWDEGTWASDEDAALYADLTGGNPAHAEDVLLILTSRRENATLVTKDKGARGRAAKVGVPTMTPNEFRALLVKT